MIAQNGHRSIAVFIEFDFRLNGILLSVNVSFAQLFLEGDWGVVRSEHFGWEIIHRLFQILVQFRGIHRVKNVVTRLLVLGKFAQKVINYRQNLNCVQISHRIFSQKVECDVIVFAFFQLDMFYAQWTTADGISFIFSLFVAHTQC